MQSSLIFFSLSKNHSFHNEISKNIGGSGQLHQFNTFISFLTEARSLMPHIVIIDYETANLTTEILEIFCSKEFAFLSCVLIVDEQNNIFNNNFVVSTLQDIDFHLNKAAVLALKNNIKRINTQNINETKNTANAVLLKLGFQTKHIGTSFLFEAIEMICERGNSLVNFNKNLYPVLAKKYSTAVNNVERNIRNSIKEAYSRVGKSTFEKVLDINTSDFPPNRTFITTLCNALIKDQQRIKQKLFA